MTDPGWTIETLRQFLAQQLVDQRDMLDERHQAQVKAIDDAFRAQQAVAEAYRRGDAEAVRVALEAQEKALAKALTALESRLNLLNELRSGVATIDQLDAVEKQLDDFKEQVASSLADLKELLHSGLGDLRSDRDQAKGQSRGISLGWAVLLGVAMLAFGTVAALGTIAAIYFALQGT